jgi:hypothetical protein
MANIITIIKLLLALGPAIIEFMISLEKLFPENGQGQQKLAMLKGYVEGIWNTLGTAVPKFEEMWPKIEAIVTAVKAIGKGTIFRKG